MVEYLKIPKERIGLLLEDEGKVLREIEARTNTKIEVDSELCELEIHEKKGTDLLNSWKARDIIKAIGRGFSTEQALQLLDENFILKIIDLKEFVGKSKNALTRIKGRIIGREGKAKQVIADSTDTEIVIHGKTVSIIGEMSNVERAAIAISMLASGSKHGSVFKMLEGG